MHIQVRGLSIAAAVAVLAVTVGAGCVAPGTPPPPTPPGTWPVSGGLSGVNGDPVINRASVEAFCTWRGRDCGVAVTYTDRASWDKMTRGSGWMFDNFAGFPGILVISQSLTPNAGGPAELASCAAGNHDRDFADFGTLMVNKGRPASVVRLGWEFNGTFMPWSAWDTEDWISCFRRAATAIRSTNPGVIIDWTINAHGTPAEICGGVSTTCYPGDAYVDIIGIDNYDHGPSVGSREEFNRVAERQDGLTWIYDFAVAHDKAFSVGEWGVAPGSQYNTHGENPEFVRWMHEWFADRAGHIAYEAYFNNCTAGDVESNLYRPAGGSCARQNTNAGNVYRSLWAA